MIVCAEASSSGRLNLLPVASQQTVNLHSHRQIPIPVETGNYDETPMDLSRSSAAETVPHLHKGTSTCDTLNPNVNLQSAIRCTTAVSSGCLVTQQRSVDTLSAVTPSQRNVPNAGSTTWPANGISTYHLVSNIFDCLINSVYGLSDASEASSKPIKRECDSSCEMSSPAKWCKTGNNTADVSSRSACDQHSVITPFPKTKKQMATCKFISDQKGLQLEKDSQDAFPTDLGVKTASDFEAMTLGELQEKLITKVVENRSFSRLLELENDKKSDTLVREANEKLLQGQSVVERSADTVPCGSSSLAFVCDKAAVGSNLSTAGRESLKAPPGLVVSTIFTSCMSNRDRKVF
jgi:hypothetical protein